MIRAPNTFLQFWKKSELKEWINELKWRNKFKDIYKSSAPTLRQTLAELKRRQC